MKQLLIRIGLLILGLFLIAAGVAVFSKASLGFDPFMIFDSGVSNALGLSLGMTHIAINLTLLLLYLLLRKRQYINLGTLLALTITGPLIDAFTWLIGHALPGEIGFASRVGMVLLACPLIGLGVYLYTGVRLGAGPNDLMAVIVSDMTGKPFGLVRILVDGVWTIAGALLGGKIGLGTLLSLFLVGASVQLWGKLRPFAKYMPQHESAHLT
ncbi:MAG: YitT family protein [Acetanaerobacterium sp.]